MQVRVLDVCVQDMCAEYDEITQVRIIAQVFSYKRNLKTAS